MRIAGDVIIIIGIVFILFGIIGIIRFNDFYAKALISAKIDTVGAITIILGVAIRNGFNFFLFKALLLIAMLMIVNPLISHTIARSAYKSGDRPDAGKPFSEKNDIIEKDEL